MVTSLPQTLISLVATAALSPENAQSPSHINNQRYKLDAVGSDAQYVMPTSLLDIYRAEEVSRLERIAASSTGDSSGEAFVEVRMRVMGVWTR